MNNLSWFIYLTKIADDINGVCSGILIAGAFLGAMALIFLTMAMDLFDVEVPFRKIFKAYVIVMICAALLGCFVPDRRTMLLIASSEIGQRAIQSHGVQEIIDPGMDLLKTWIKRETDKLMKDAAK